MYIVVSKYQNKTMKHKCENNYVSIGQIMNIIFRRCLSMLKLTEIRRDFYDPDAATEIQVRNEYHIS